MAGATSMAGSSVADLFTVTLQSGTVYRWTSWDQILTVGSNAFASGNNAAGQPWLSRSRWNVVNTMEIPTLEIFIDTTAVAGFAGGPTLLAQIQNGLFDGATCLLQRVFMPTPGDTATWGTIDLFLGDIGAATLVAPRCTLKVRGKNSRLSVNTPRNVYQAGCTHTFCDPGCTLSAATFTFSYTVAASPAPTRTSFGVVGTPPIFGSVHFKGGTLKMTSGVDIGQSKGIIDIAYPVVTLATPLLSTPVAGDALTIFSACDKTTANCTVYSNFVNFRGFPYILPPGTTAAGQT